MFDAHIICRYSSQDKGDASIDRQREQCLAVAVKLGCDPKNIKTIENDNLSGALPWNKRVDLLELERDINAGQCKRLIVYRSDRLARDSEVSGKLYKLLMLYNIQLHDESGEFDYSTAMGQAFYEIKASIASLERRLITERMYNGKRFRFQHGGNWGGAIPLGIKADGKMLVEDVEGMKIVNAIFRRMAQGSSIRKIEHWTIEHGIQLMKPRRTSGINGWSIRAILTNEFYVTGKYNIATKKEGLITNNIELSQPVPKDIFDTVQSMLKSRAPGRPTKGTYLLSGLVYPLLPSGLTYYKDEQTGETIYDGEYWEFDRKIRFHPQTKNGIPCYYCAQWGQERRKEGVYITGHGKRQKKQYAFISKDMLEDKVWNALEKMAEKPENLIRSVNSQAAVMQADKVILDGFIKNKVALIKTLETALNRFYNIFGQSGDDRDLNKIQDTKQQLAQAEKDLIAMQNKHQSIHLTMDDAEELLETFKVIHNLRLNGSPDDKLAFIHKYINRITIDPYGNIQIRGKFDIAKDNKGCYPRWSKGSVVMDKIKSDNFSSVATLLAMTLLFFERPLLELPGILFPFSFFLS